MSNPTTSREKRAARQRRYYESHRENIKEKARQRYDPERKSQYYLENRDDILEISHLRYIAQRAERVRTALEEMATEMPEHSEVLLETIRSGRHHSMKPKDVKTLRAVLVPAPAPPPRNTSLPVLEVQDIFLPEPEPAEPDVVELLRITVPAKKPPQNEIIYPD